MREMREMREMRRELGFTLMESRGQESKGELLTAPRDEEGPVTKWLAAKCQ
jgi:hypothetical protein